jgi:hypothetical protein
MYEGDAPWDSAATLVFPPAMAATCEQIRPKRQLHKVFISQSAFIDHGASVSPVICVNTRVK